MTVITPKIRISPITAFGQMTKNNINNANMMYNIFILC